MLFPCSGMLINNKINKLLIHAKIWIDLKEFMVIKKKKKIIPKVYTLYNIIYIIFLELENFGIKRQTNDW